MCECRSGGAGRGVRCSVSVCQCISVTVVTFVGVSCHGVCLNCFVANLLLLLRLLHPSHLMFPRSGNGGGIALAQRWSPRFTMGVEAPGGVMPTAEGLLQGLNVAPRRRVDGMTNGNGNDDSGDDDEEDSWDDGAPPGMFEVFGDPIPIPRVRAPGNSGALPVSGRSPEVSSVRSPRPSPKRLSRFPSSAPRPPSPTPPPTATPAAPAPPSPPSTTSFGSELGTRARSSSAHHASSFAASSRL